MMTKVVLEEQGKLQTLIASLQHSTCFSHPIESFQILQTHISFILLTGPFAYKFKKPVEFGFLDFSSLEKRKYFINEELRLNRRLAPTLYREVMPITGSVTAPVLDGNGSVIEYVLKMVQFPQSDQLDRVLVDGRLTRGHIDGLTRTLADFHARVPVAPAGLSFGNADRIGAQVLANFDYITATSHDEVVVLKIRDLRQNTLEQINQLTPDFEQRKQQGFVRECHGDLHLTNMVLMDNEVVIFDCVEFSEALRWVDVMSELAFLIMDLNSRNRSDLAWRILNNYLEVNGDYTGLRIFDFYCGYRSMVRAKIAEISRQHVEDNRERDNQRERLLRHIDLAEFYSRKRNKPTLIITHGLSGSGKTTVTEQLIEEIGALRIRSDFERKRLQGFAAQTRTWGGIGEGIYSEAITQQTYDHLLQLAETILTNGFSVFVDAAFLKRSQRNAFRNLATDLDVSFCILDFYADEATLRSRISARQQSGQDASEATRLVLEHQLSTRDEPAPLEHELAIRIHTGNMIDLEALSRNIKVLTGYEKEAFSF